MEILLGKTISEKVRKRLRLQVSKLARAPKLVIIQVGDLPESNKYIEMKKLFGASVGVTVIHEKYPKSISMKALEADLEKFNKDKFIQGIIIQLPIPKHLDIGRLTSLIAPEKDVDCLTPINIKHLFNGREVFLPATTRGILTLFKHKKISLKGKEVVMVGESLLVGRPTFLALVNRGATVTVCHAHTKNLAQKTQKAEILISATGRPKLIGKEHVSKGQIVVDVGFNVDKKGRLSGDVDFDNVKGRVRMITPVPGGVGPLTVASLFENLLDSGKMPPHKRD